ncbi:DUF748 domain-containing protein, partial [Thioalkalivibrio sp.]|uniref:DUF748 domain-containing protein n=1 Tax=Thioalkalivibrio sp. TaxID=2093813 RepID=UPI003975D227
MHKDSVRRFGGYLRTRWASPRRIRFWLLVLITLYTLLGFFGLPWIIQYLAVTTAQEDLGRELRIEAIQANPYLLTLRIDGVELDDIDNRQLLGWNRLFIDLAWSSVVNRAWTFETIRFDQPIIQEERFASGETRLSRLAAEQSDKGPSDDESAPLPALRINDLRVEDGVLRFADNLQDATAAAADHPKRVTLELQDVGLSVKQFALQKGTRSPLRLEGQLSGGGMLAFDGTLQLLPTPGLEGSARIDELSLVQAAPYLRQFADVQLVSGTLDLSGQMQTDAQEPFAFQGSAGVKALNITAGPNDEPLIGWQGLHTERLGLRLKDRQLETDPIFIDGLSGRVVIYEDQTTNFGQIIAQRPSADAEDDSDPGRTDEEAAPFGIIIEAIDLTDGALRFAAYYLPLPFSTSIHTLGGQISILSSTSAEPSRIKLE